MSPQRMQTITATDMRAINRSAILELIRSGGSISRSEIGQRLQVSLPTVMRIVDELIEDELVRPTQTKEWTGGRKRALVEFNGASRLVIGLDLGGTKLYGGVVDLTGHIHCETTIPQHQTRSDESFDRVCRMIDELLAYARGTGLKLLGIGAGVPGVTDPASGQVELAPGLDWFGYPLKQRLSERYATAIVVENDVNLAALGEVWFGPHGDAQNLVLIAVGTGIGAGVVINGQVYSGAHAMAGEIGYMLPDRANLGQAYPGFGALELVASGTGIAARARQALQGQMAPGPLAAISAEDVFAAGRRGEAWALPILAETIDTLAQSIAAITLLLDPEVILLGGGVSHSSDLLIEPILNRLRGTIPRLPRLETSTLGYRAALMGSIVALMRVGTDYYSLQKY
ncbi:MAG TPA: ROK family transcriptional regulator [Anaerolineaceae bacterium]